MAVPSRSPLRPLHAPGTVPAPALGGLDLLRGEPRPAGAVGERGAPQKLPGPPFPQQARLVLVLRGHRPGVRGHRGMLSPPGAVPSQALSPPRCPLPLSPLSPASPSSCPLHVLSPLYPSAVPSLLSPMSPLGAVPAVPSSCPLPAVPAVPSCHRLAVEAQGPLEQLGQVPALGHSSQPQPDPHLGLDVPAALRHRVSPRGHWGHAGGQPGDTGGVWRGQRGDTEQRWRGLGGDEVGIGRGRGAGTWWGQRGDMEGHKETRRDIRGHRRTQEKGEGHNGTRRDTKGTRRDTGECGGTQRGYRGTQRDTEGHRGTPELAPGTGSGPSRTGGRRRWGRAASAAPRWRGHEPRPPAAGPAAATAARRGHRPGAAGTPRRHQGDRRGVRVTACYVSRSVIGNYIVLYSIILHYIVLYYITHYSIV